MVSRIRLQYEKDTHLLMSAMLSIIVAAFLLTYGTANATGYWMKPRKEKHDTKITSKKKPEQNLLLLRHPTMSKNKIVFEYGGEIWEVPRKGGKAHVLASGMDMLSMPIFSPDGSKITFTGTFDSNTDVY